MIAKSVMRDERTVAVENASYRVAYLVLSYGLLLSTAYRAFVSHEASWDLMGLVIVGGGVAATYQGTKGILTTRSARMSAAAMVAAAVIGAALVLMRR